MALFRGLFGRYEEESWTYDVSASDQGFFRTLNEEVSRSIDASASDQGFVWTLN
jgi:hypothetical protein